MMAVSTCAAEIPAEIPAEHVAWIGLHRNRQAIMAPGTDSLVITCKKGNSQQKILQKALTAGLELSSLPIDFATMTTAARPGKLNSVSDELIEKRVRKFFQILITILFPRVPLCTSLALSVLVRFRLTCTNLL
jgi:hypothetical protein